VSAEYRVYARDVAYRRLGEIDDYGSFGAVQRFNAPGTWHLTAAGASSAATLLTITGGIIVERNLGDGWRVVFSGPVTDLKLSETEIEVAGVSDEALLAEYLALPDPSGQPYATEHDIRAGIGSTVMRQYVEHNLGSLALADRQIPQLELAADSGIGAFVIGSARWETMLYLLQELALAAGGLRFHVLQSDASSSLITFSITMPEDRTGQVVVARERGNLGEWTRTQIRPQVTYGYVLGQGLGTARQVVEGGDAAASTRYGRRIEAAIDRRDTANGDELAQALATSLQDGGEQSAVDYVPIDSDTFEWGVDYDLGDRVTVVVDGEQLDEIVREVELSLGAGSHDPVVKPIISTPGDAADDPSARQLNALHRRTSNLERNSDTQLPLFQQVAVGDIKLTARASADPGWLVCDGAAVSRTTYHGLFGVIGTTYGAGDGVATFNLPDLRDRAPVGASLTHPLASAFGAATADISHLHDPGTLLGPLHGHLSGTLANPNHGHAAGTLANPNHPHAAGTLKVGVHGHANTLTIPNHGHAAGTLKVGVHGHGNTLTIPNHQHAAGTLAGPLHNHTAAALGVGGTGTGAVLQAGSAAGTDLDTSVNLSHGGVDKVARDQHTHGPGSLDVTGATDNGGNGAVTGSTATDGGGGSLAGGVSNSAGTEAVTGSTATDGGGGSLSGGVSNSAGTEAVTGSTATDGGATITGATATDGATTITGSTANGGNGAVTGQTATGGSSAIALYQPSLALVAQIFTGV
jgi:microcystin-dependent protein